MYDTEKHKQSTAMSAGNGAIACVQWFSYGLCCSCLLSVSININIFTVSVQNNMNF